MQTSKRTSSLDFLRRGFTLSVALITALLLYAAPEARAQGDDGPGSRQEGPPRGGKGHRGHESSEMLRRLNLSPEQVAQIREIRRQSEPAGDELARRISAARRALDEVIYADVLDESLIEARVRELAEAQAAMVRLRAATETKVRRVLTPEQLQVFRDVRQKARGRMGGKRKFGRERRGGPPPVSVPDQL